jgi:hypothetical protein
MENNYIIETTDIGNFWTAFDSIKSADDKTKVFNELYLDEASELFKKMISLSGDIRNPENYLESFEKYPKFWESLRKPTLELQNITSDIQSCYEKVKNIYPEFKPGNVCVFVGPIAIQASVPTGDIIFMGAEMNVPLNEIDLSEFQEDMSFIYLNDIKSTIIHETIHLQQKDESKNLLELTIREGSADFLAELFLGEPFKSPIYDYGKKNELELWTEFSKELDNTDWNKWFYAKSKTEERPADVGYFIGYMITKSYYDKARDKNKAIEEIIEVSDFHQFLDKSGYPEKFEK